MKKLQQLAMVLDPIHCSSFWLHSRKLDVFSTHRKSLVFRKCLEVFIDAEFIAIKKVIQLHKRHGLKISHQKTFYLFKKKAALPSTCWFKLFYQ